MTYTIQIDGMTCEGCEYKLEHLILELDGVSSVIADNSSNSIRIKSKEIISQESIQNLIQPYPKYSIGEEFIIANSGRNINPNSVSENSETSFKPLVLIACFIALVSILSAYNLETHSQDWMKTMRYFMAGFFIVFSFFKCLDLTGFADSYQMYDVLASKSRAYAVSYPFIELGLGILYLLNLFPVETNIATATIMGISIIGVIRAVVSKTKIQCACLGSVFNLPMTTVTIIEDGLMIIMALGMLVYLL